MDNVNSIIMELLGLIDQKSQLFDNIMEITLEQKIDIEQNEANNIQQFVNNKQVVIDSIDKIDKIFSDKLGLLKKVLNIDLLENADYAKYPILKELKQKVGRIMELAQEIMIVEESNKEKLNLVMNGLMKDMRQLSIGKKSIRAYEAPVMNNDGIYIDKKK